MILNIQSNPIFEPVHAWKGRYIIEKGSAGSGKSVDTAQQYILRLLQDKGRNLLCVRKVEQSNRNSTYAELIGAIRRLGVSEYFPNSTVNPLSIKCMNGNQVLFAGVNDDKQREKLKSITTINGSLTDVWIEEATEIQQFDYEIIDDRLRGELPKGLFYQLKMTFNPVSATHWIKKNFFDREDKQVLTHHSTYLDNMFIDAAYYMRMQRKKELDPEGYQIYGLGEWGETAGLVFTNWKEIVVPRDEEDYDDVSLGQDFGYNHANAILSLGTKDNDIYIRKELICYEMDPEMIISKAKGMFNKGITMYCDGANPDKVVTWNRARYQAVSCKKGTGSVIAQLDWLKGKTKNGDYEKKTIYVDVSCTHTIKELGQYRWKKDTVRNIYLDEPVPFFDDAMAALRYGVQPWRLQGGVYLKNKIVTDDSLAGRLREHKEKIINGNKTKRRHY